MRDYDRLNGKIIVKSDCVIKYDDPERLRIEVEKMLRACEIAEECGLFRVPKVLDFDPILGKARMEKLESIKPLKSLLNSTMDCSYLMMEVGEALAIIHEKLVLPSDMVIRLPSLLEGPVGTEVFIHGDFNMVNVNYSMPDRKLVILDWQMTKVWGGKATFGTAFFDMSVFIHTMFFQRFFDLATFRPLLSYAESFVRSYFDARGNPFLSELFWGYCGRVFKEFFASNRGRLSLKGLIARFPWIVRLYLFSKNCRFRHDSKTRVGSLR